MWDGYLTAIAEFIETHPEIEAKIVVDRFHVAQNYRNNFDQLRKSEFRRLRQELSSETYHDVVKGNHWLLRHNHASLSEEERKKLRTLFVYSPQLHQAYSLREELTAIFELPLTVTQGANRLQKWIDKVLRLNSLGFDKFIKTLRNHFAYIANYFHTRANSGFVEGLNNKLKLITRRSFGLKRVDSLFSRLWLNLQGRTQFCS